MVSFTALAVACLAAASMISTVSATKLAIWRDANSKGPKGVHWLGYTGSGCINELDGYKSYAVYDLDPASMCSITTYTGWECKVYTGENKDSVDRIDNYTVRTPPKQSLPGGKPWGQTLQKSDPAWASLFFSCSPDPDVDIKNGYNAKLKGDVKKGKGKGDDSKGKKKGDDSKDKKKNKPPRSLEDLAPIPLGPGAPVPPGASMDTREAREFVA
ncbi:hypothetical protein BU16DRAFT_521097 [Lophium mytilinum]|uniref:Uncharacterized protein n=1 Tax=Lophium mytilinum TaxID=390894 RepID=A0A6A6RF38_9PEZI|nr:hypothetical protein BU16DRAFT_521097 [Lophium mytilinum]